MTTRLAVLKAWEQAQLRADTDGAVTLDSAAFAGQALVTANGDAVAAMRLVPTDLVTFWGRVRSHLLAIVAEEVGRQERNAAHLATIRRLRAERLAGAR